MFAQLMQRLFQVSLASMVLCASAHAADAPGKSDVKSDWRADLPGHRLHLKAADIPAPETGNDPEKSIAGNVKVVPAKEGALPKVPTGFDVEVFAKGFKQPRTLRTAPNGDVFLSESGQGRVLVFPKGTSTPKVFAENLEQLFVSIGSASNLGVAGMPAQTPEQIRAHEATDGRGAAWGEERNRGVVRVLDLDGKNIRNFATGLRNCSGMAMQPGTGTLWCVVNERDHLGPYVTPDFMARIEDGAFFGWPWYYLGGIEDPALKGRRPELKAHVRMPDVLFQAHSSALSLVFYDHDAFPDAYRGDAFVALHGSHSRPDMTGYKVVRVPMEDGRASGEYEDFMTGFVVRNGEVWGRPAGLTVTSEGAVLVSDDANGTIFKVTRKSSP